MEWGAAGTVRQYALQWTGYMRRGKAGLEKADEGIGQDGMRCVTQRTARGCLVICRVRVTGVRAGSGQIVHEQRGVRNEKKGTRRRH